MINFIRTHSKKRTIIRQFIFRFIFLNFFNLMKRQNSLIMSFVFIFQRLPWKFCIVGCLRNKHFIHTWIKIAFFIVFFSVMRTNCFWVVGFYWLGIIFIFTFLTQIITFTIPFRKKNYKKKKERYLYKILFLKKIPNVCFIKAEF